MKDSTTEVNVQKNGKTNLTNIYNKNLLEKYFYKWKMYVIENSKLNNFITSIKHHQLNSTKTTTDNRVTGATTSSASFNNYKNRYQAQRKIINNQKNKIEEQSKLISELKIGIIREDLLRSIENTKFEIRDIFANSSNQLIRQAPIVQAIDERQKIMLESQKAPKFIQKINERALQRAKNRQIILERKRIVDELRQRLLEEAIEKKRIIEEEEQKRNLELLSQRRKKELEIQKLRHERQRIFETKLRTAVNFHEKLLVKQCFKKLFINWNRARDSWMMAVYFNRQKRKSTSFKYWLKYVTKIYEKKYEKADIFCKRKMLIQYINEWKEFQLNRRKYLQLAENLYVHHLVKNTFVYWHRIICKQIMIQNKKIDVAKQHAIRRLIFHCFYKWKSLPVVLQLEKAQEERKRKWREKVWEILPDYQPQFNE